MMPNDVLFIIDMSADSPFLPRVDALAILGHGVAGDRGLTVRLSQCADVSNGWEELLSISKDPLQPTQVCTYI